VRLMAAKQPRRSPEVEAIITRLFEAWANQDSDTIERLTPSSPEFRAIGTDPTEWWDGATFAPVMRAQLEEMSRTSRRSSRDPCHGWRLGSRR
jgi:hypothetical protein